MLSDYAMVYTKEKLKTQNPSLVLFLMVSGLDWIDFPHNYEQRALGPSIIRNL